MSLCQIFNRFTFKIFKKKPAEFIEDSLGFTTVNASFVNKNNVSNSIATTNTCSTTVIQTADTFNADSKTADGNGSGIVSSSPSSSSSEEESNHNVGENEDFNKNGFHKTTTNSVVDEKRNVFAESGDLKMMIFILPCNHVLLNSVSHCTGARA